jgi:hypothetical protein
MIPLVLALAFIIYITIIYTLLKKKSNKLEILLNTFNDRECNLIFRIILHDKSIFKDSLKLILNFLFTIIIFKKLMTI